MCADCDEFNHATTRGKPKTVVEQLLDDLRPIIDEMEGEKEHWPEINGLMPRQRRPYGFPVSRDWEHLDCKAVGCRWNKNEHCMVPSLAKISADGRCEGFEFPPYQIHKPDSDCYKTDGD